MLKRLIFDLDQTLSFTSGGDYANATPNIPLINKLRHYHQDGFTIVINTSRNMRTYDGNLGKINTHTLPVIMTWLETHKVPYDEIYVGKPWCGFEGFYIDDKAVRPDEFVRLNYQQLCELVGITTMANSDTRNSCQQA